MRRDTGLCGTGIMLVLASGALLSCLSGGNGREGPHSPDGSAGAAGTPMTGAGGSGGAGGAAGTPMTGAGGSGGGGGAAGTPMTGRGGSGGGGGAAGTTTTGAGGSGGGGGAAGTTTTGTGGSGGGGGKACAWAGTTWDSGLVGCPISGSLCTITYSFGADGCYSSEICATGEYDFSVSCDTVSGHWTAANCGTINVVASDGSTTKLSSVSGPDVGGVLTIGNYSFTRSGPYSCPPVRPSCVAATPAGASKCGSGMSCIPDCGHTVGTSVPLACFQAGTGSDGASCKGSSDCAIGMACIAYNGGVKVCRTLCATDQDCSPGYGCSGPWNCNGTPAGKYCRKACSDITKAGSAVCGSVFKCGGVCNSTGVAPEMTCDGVPGTGTNGATCGTGTAGCALGFVCDSNKCVQACKTITDCTTGGTCIGNLLCATNNGPVNSGQHYCK
jgi:hypothetical protein